MRFVVLHHTGWPGHADHYDLMLQIDAGESDDDLVLATFSTLADVFPDGITDVELKATAPHRRLYLSKEGPITPGKGIVRREDEGEIVDLQTSKNSLTIELSLAGRRLNGSYRISKSGAGKLNFEKTK